MSDNELTDEERDLRVLLRRSARNRTLAELREHCEMTIEELADALNESVEDLAKWEDGDLSLTLYNACIISSILGDRSREIYNGPFDRQKHVDITKVIEGHRAAHSRAELRKIDEQT